MKGRNSMVYPLLRTVRKRKKEPRVLKDNYIYVNKETGFNLYADEGLQMAWYAQTGAGKTMDSVIVASQFPYGGLYYDPTNAVKRNIQRIGAQRRWKFYKLTENEEEKNRLFINANMITEPFIMKCFPTRGEGAIRLAFTKFLELDFEERTCKNLEIILRRARLTTIFYYMRKFLHPQDEGLTLQDFYDNKICVDTSEESSKDTLFLGIVAGKVMQDRQSKGLNEYPPFFIAVDEAQDHLEKFSYNAKIMDFVYGQGRSINVSAMFTCNGISAMTRRTTNNVRIFFIGKINFPVKQITERITLPLFDEDVQSIPFSREDNIRGWCYYINTVDESGTPRLLLPNNYFLTASKRRVVEDDEKISF